MNDSNKVSSFGEAIGTIIAKICFPLADEIGEELSTRIGAWRSKNVKATLQSASKKYDKIIKKSEIIYYSTYYI